MSTATPRPPVARGRPHRVLLVGLGWVARTVWLPLLEQDPRFVLVGAVDPDPAAAAGLAGLPVLTDLPSADRLVADVAFVATPNATHAEISCALLRRGVSAFIEKPISLTAEQLEEVARAAEESGAIVVPSAASRLRSDVTALHALVSEGAVGEPRAIELSWVRSRGVPRPGSWYTTRRCAGGGALLDLGWHLADVGRALLPRHARVSRVASACFADHLALDDAAAAWRGDAAGEAPRDVEDTGIGFFVVDDAVAVTIRAAWASHQSRDVTSIAVEGRDAAATLTTTFGFSPDRVAQPELVLRRRGEERRCRLEPAAVGEEYRRQLDVLDARLSGRADWREGFEEARWVLDLILRMYADAR